MVELPEPLLRALVAQSPDVILLVGRRGEITYANPAAESLLGWPPGDLVGQSVGVLVPEAMRTAHGAMVQEFGKAPRGRGMGTGLELRAATRSGELLDVDIMLVPLQGSELIAVFVRDISALRSTEREVARGIRELAEAHARLTVAHRHLEASNHERERLLGIAVHDLRGPIGAVAIALEATIEGWVDARSPGGRETLRGVLSQARRLQQMADALVDGSAVDSGRLELRRTDVDVRALIEHAVELARGSARNRAVVLRLDAPSHPVLVRADEGKLQQVVATLLHNAVRFSMRSAEVVVRLRDDLELVSLEVEDHGPGMSRDVVDSLFDLSMRGPRDGLALVIAHRIVRGHGGAIHVQSEPGEGARFTVRIPRFDAAPRQPST